MRRLLVLMGFLYAGALCLPAETVTFDNVKIRRQESPQKRVLVDKVGVLSFDDAGRKLSFVGRDDKIEVGYDDVTKIVFEVTTHMRGGWLPVAVGYAGAYGAIASAAITNAHVHDYWLYLEYKNGEHNEPALLEVPKELSDKVIDKTTSLFGTRVTMQDFQKGEEIEKEGKIDEKRLPDFPSKHTMKVDKENHPLPETKPDKATIVVVCPSLSARNVGQGNQYKLHANDHVVAVNKFGTYSFAYVDPGNYSLVSQSENASGFEIKLEAGKAYYFLQNSFSGTFKGHTTLSRNSPELVLYELNHSYFSDWTRK
jgi:hypothetical protein